MVEIQEEYISMLFRQESPILAASNTQLTISTKSNANLLIFVEIVLGLLQR